MPEQGGKFVGGSGEYQARIGVNARRFGDGWCVELTVGGER